MSSGMNPWRAPKRQRPTGFARFAVAAALWSSPGIDKYPDDAGYRRSRPHALDHGAPPSPSRASLRRAGPPDFDAELEQLSMDPWRPPARIGDAHLPEPLSYFQRHLTPLTKTTPLTTP